jgi:nucleoside-diphosphate-sugar epimerase
MVIGNGFLAKAFAVNFSDDPSVVIFASGVSNSREIRNEQFLREQEMLRHTLNQNNHLVYLSSSSVLDTQLENSPYVRHKLEMERLVSESDCCASVFRLPQVVGHSNNPYTLTNFLYQKVFSGTSFQLWGNAKRNLIDVCDAVEIMTHLIRSRSMPDSITHIAMPWSISVIELVKIFETLLGKRADYKVLEMGGEYEIEAGLAMCAAREIGIVFDEQYVVNLIRKYYA